MTLREAAQRIVALEATQERILAEMRLLRRGQMRADAESCEALLGYIRDEFQDEPWTVVSLFDAAFENGLLHGAIVRCIGENLSIQKVAKSLMRLIGDYGIYRLRCINRRSRTGARFTVTQSVTPSQRSHASVSHHRFAEE